MNKYPIKVDNFNGLLGRLIIILLQRFIKLKNQKSTRMEQYKKPIFNATIVNKKVDFSQVSVPDDIRNHMNLYSSEYMAANPDIET